MSDTRPQIETDAFGDSEFRRIAAAAGARMLGFDGTSVEEAARQAVVAGGPSLEELTDMIRERRRHPNTPGKVTP